jgi:hypothetical protein
VLAEAPANVYVVPDTVAVPNDGAVVADVDDPDTVAINCVPFCAKEEIVNGIAAVTAENAVEGSETFPPDDAVTVSVYVVPIVAEIFAAVTPVTVPNCDPSEFLRMNWVPATVPPYVHDALTLVEAGMYVIDPGTGVERVVKD